MAGLAVAHAILTLVLAVLARWDRVTLAAQIQRTTMALAAVVAVLVLLDSPVIHCLVVGLTVAVVVPAQRPVFPGRQLHTLVVVALVAQPRWVSVKMAAVTARVRQLIRLPVLQTQVAVAVAAMALPLSPVVLAAQAL